jgi:hypothetical protein
MVCGDKKSALYLASAVRFENSRAKRDYRGYRARYLDKVVGKVIQTFFFLLFLVLIIFDFLRR